MAAGTCRRAAVEADPAEEGSLDGEAQGAEQVFVAQEHQGEGGSLAPAKAQEHADFLQGGDLAPPPAAGVATQWPSSIHASKRSTGRQR